MSSDSAKQLLEAPEPESLRKRHERAFGARRVGLAPARHGMTHLDAYIDAADAAVLKTGLQNAAREARGLGDARTTSQLEADLLVDLLGDGRVAIGSARDETVADRLRDRAPVSVEVLIPAATLAGGDELPATVPGLGAIDPARARELVARAPSLRRILTDPIDSAIVDFDRTSYRVPSELKRIIRVRDGHCRAPSCSAPVARTEIDHTLAFARGGATAPWNLACLCRNHHHLKHETALGAEAVRRRNARVALARGQAVPHLPGARGGTTRHAARGSVERRPRGPGGSRTLRRRDGPGLGE